MDVGEVYLILLRPSRVPVAGEAVAHGFQGQVQLHDWRWTLHNSDERQRIDHQQRKFSKADTHQQRKRSEQVRTRHLMQDLIRAKEKAFDDANESAGDLKASERFKDACVAIDKRYGHLLEELKQDRRLRDKAEQAEHDEHKRRDREVEEAERNRSFEFRFSKRVDLASTQMLNSMKLGDVFTSGTLTIHQRSVNSGMSLVINLQKVRLLDYGLRVEVSDTMTDMVETWTAEFSAMGYSYKNRNAIGGSANALQAGMKAATQGTVRAFAMQNMSLSI